MHNYYRINPINKALRFINHYFPRYVFIHINKTAGSSIERALMLRSEHKTAMVKMAELGEVRWNKAFKFSFVRNPWSRILSEYRYRNYFHHLSFRDFVLNKLPRPGWDDQYRHVMPQYDMLHDRQGNLLVDFVGRFETLQQDFDKVCERLGIVDSRLPHRNRSDKKSRDLKRKLRNFLFMNGENRFQNMAEFYDDETREAVTEYYRKDIDTFGYEF